MKKEKKKPIPCPKCGKKKKDLAKHEPFCQGEIEGKMIVAELKPDENIPLEVPKTNTIENKSDFQIEPQKENVLQDVAPLPAQLPAVVPEKKIEVKPEIKPPAPIVDEGQEERQVLSESVHRMAANFVEYFTNDEIEVDDKHVKALSNMGARLLKKYDQDNYIGMHGIEFAYITTLADVASMIYLELRRKRRIEEKKLKALEDMKKGSVDTEVVKDGTKV